jgi:hypothetical protein
MLASVSFIWFLKYFCWFWRNSLCMFWKNTHCEVNQIRVIFADVWFELVHKSRFCNLKEHLSWTLRQNVLLAIRIRELYQWLYMLLSCQRYPPVLEVWEQLFVFLSLRTVFFPKLDLIIWNLCVRTKLERKRTTSWYLRVSPATLGMPDNHQHICLWFSMHNRLSNKTLQSDSNIPPCL